MDLMDALWLIGGIAVWSYVIYRVVQVTKARREEAASDAAASEAGAGTASELPPGEEPTER